MASATAVFSLATVLLLSLLHVSTAETPKPPQSLLNAAETLSNSGYNAMSLTLELILTDSSISLQSTTATAKSSSHPTLTIFTPPDSSFENSGQPSLNLLLLHFSPLSLSLSSLSSLPYATRIPTLSHTNSSLFITSPPGNSPLTINNVNVIGSPVYDDGSVIVYAIEDFFTPNFTPQNTIQNAPSTTPECTNFAPFSSLFDASAAMKSRGYSIMASFLELQLMGYLKFSPWPLKMTLFAPEDGVLVNFSGDFPSYGKLFMTHLLPCKMSWVDLNGVSNGTMFKDYVEGASIKIEKTDKEIMVNGVDITFPDMYYSDWLVIHGIRDVISQQQDGTEEEDELEEEEDGSMSYEEKSLSPVGSEL